jgi:splicing suppressor protein 51
MESAGARLVSALGPRRNPWGSELAKVEPNQVAGFFSVNGYVAGAFK